jgi:uncharacterized protein YndB with AHSA1/START domain
MPDILHRLSIDAPPSRVHELISTPAGIETWWTGHAVRGRGGAGGQLAMLFGGSEPAAVVDVVEDRAEHIVWRVVEGPPDWLDTTITFTFWPATGGTTLLFGHAGWREAGEFMANCTSEWASYLIGLKAGLEGRAFTPFPGGQVSRFG